VQRFTATSDLPPRLRTYLGELSLETGPLVSQLSAGYRETDDGWEPDNIVQFHRLSVLDEQMQFDQRLEYNTTTPRVERARSSVSGYGLEATLTGRHAQEYTFQPGSGWEEADGESFQWTNASLGLGIDREIYTWKRRMNLSIMGDADLVLDLQRFTNSSLALRYGFSLDIHQFLDIEFSARTRNDLVYQYVPALAKEVDRPHRPLAVDLVDSLMIFDRERRESTFFKLESLNISAVHDLQDWVLEIEYSGQPELNQQAQPPTYRWRSVLAILLRWRPISELRRSIEVEDGVVEFGQQ
jgi:hypothetical protein